MKKHRFISWYKCGLIREIKISIDNGKVITSKVILHTLLDPDDLEKIDMEIAIFGAVNNRTLNSILQEA